MPNRALFSPLLPDLYDTQGEFRGWRIGIYVLRFINFSKITLRLGYKFDKFALFYISLGQATHPIRGILVFYNISMSLLLSFRLFFSDFHFNFKTYDNISETKL